MAYAVVMVLCIGAILGVLLTAIAISALRASESARSIRLAAFASHPALVQLKLRLRMAAASPRMRAAVRDTRGSDPPRFAGRLEDLVGLYLSPPEHALVW